MHICSLVEAMSSHRLSGPSRPDMSHPHSCCLADSVSAHVPEDRTAMSEWTGRCLHTCTPKIPSSPLLGRQRVQTEQIAQLTRA